MTVMNATKFRQNLFNALEQTVKYNEPVCITGKAGNAVLISEEDYRDLIATLELSAVPGMEKKILDGLATSVEDCLTEEEVEW